MRRPAILDRMKPPKLYIQQEFRWLALPILPGKAEAWRRFIQERAGSQRALFCEWLAVRGLSRCQVWVRQQRGEAFALVRVEVKQCVEMREATGSVLRRFE